MTETRITLNELEGLRQLISRESNMVEKAKLQKELLEKEHQYNLNYEERLKEIENEHYYLGSK